jgi:two-component system response regulator AtoC
MAGSHDVNAPSIPCDDPIIRVRIDTLKHLADGVSERVAVLDRAFNVMYANQAVWSESAQSESATPPAKCYEAFTKQRGPCGSCPATAVFDSQQGQTLPCAAEGGTACGMHRVLPLMSSAGDVGSVLVLFKHQPMGPAVREEGLRPVGAGKQVVSAKDRLGGLIGQSPPMQQLFHMMRLIADTSATVLIQGESGTGKELAAKTIHELNYRRTKPFVVVDCGSLPETLLESELFGHVKGAFTGAAYNKRGLFEEADGGTLFLDEIADTTPAFQAKLLRVLQEGEIRRVGSSRPIKIDVRVISATNKDLVELVRAKQFREDLYYRLAVLPLYLPALRDRRSDIPLLASHFVAVACRRHRQPLRTIADDAMRALSEARWPGNVRELQHYIERAVVTTGGPELSCKEFMAEAPGPHVADLRTAVRGAAQQVERTKIIEALRLASGNRVRAAKLLNISRASLYNKLREYEIR